MTWGSSPREYHPGERRQLGNFPQAFSHIGLVNAATNLTRTRAETTDLADPR